MTTNQTITTAIVKEDAEVFLAFQRHREKFLVLLKSGALDLPSGQVEINVNNGQIQSVHIHNMTYRRANV